MIEVTELGKSFGAVEAVRSVSFLAQDGTVTALLGPNGAGKTTTLRILTGLMSPDLGTVRVDGVDVRSDRLGVQHRIGVLPDARGLYPRLTAREHVEYFGRLQGMSESALRTRFTAIAEFLALTELADRRVAGFSHGERSRVALARALIHEPRNVILDEPTNGLDIAGARSVRRIIRELRERGRCVLFSSHITQEVLAVCDRIVLIARGAVVGNGTPTELTEQSGCDNLEDAIVTLTGLGSVA